MTVIQTLEQRRARHAWESVQMAKTLPSAGDYSREAKRLPIQIMTAGLGHAIAFLDAKGGAGKEVADNVAFWVLELLKRTSEKRSHGEKPAQKNQARELLKKIIENDSDWLRRSTEESISYLKWLSRIAEIELKDENPAQEL
ncbi:MAG: type III-B CRISPR module-associated protein Cmr5 [Aestuariivita sp.]|nr:type III-B CRISPR module-associated protein Cmr5 [Aestuariivita sp.]